MKKVFYALVLILLISACSEEVRQAPLTKEETNGERIWKRITEEADYEDYAFWPGHEGIQPGQAPHGVNHRIFINQDLLEALPIADRVAPYGTIIVKENMDRDKNLDKIAVMAKVEGSDPEFGDWFYALYTKEGEVIVEGKPDGCFNCHWGMRDNDYIIIRRLDQEQ